MKVGIYGGTYNPPHLGHFQAARAVAAELGLDKLLLIPAAQPPHKPLPEGSPSAAQRLAMTELMADALALPGLVEVSELELLRQGASYTSQTVEQVQGLYPQGELWLLMGSDMFLSLHSWHDPAAIFRGAKVCAFARSRQDDMALLTAQRQRLKEQFCGESHILTLPEVIEASSTQLRTLLARGEGEAFLLPAVYGYILRHRLYNTHADLTRLSLSQLRACSYSMIQHKRVAHVRGTEEEAARLARRWGVEETLARHAGILHDCTKYLELEAQLALCEQNALELDELERHSAKLLHAKTGACIARSIFGEPDEVYEAIRCHTTGKAGMTTLDKILYIADYIEPNRDFEGVDALRTLAYQDLDRAVLVGLETTMQEMRERGLTLHPNTLQAQSWLHGCGVNV